MWCHARVPRNVVIRLSLLRCRFVQHYVRHIEESEAAWNSSGLSLHLGFPKESMTVMPRGVGNT